MSYDPYSHPDAYCYAYTLALAAHLAEVEKKFLALPAEEHQSLEQTLWANDMATNFHLVREFGILKVAQYYRDQDIIKHCPQGQYRQSLSYGMEQILLGPLVESHSPSSTENILDRADDIATYAGVLLYTTALLERLYNVLQNSARITDGDKWYEGISRQLGHFLRTNVSDLSTQLDLGALSMQADAVAAHLGDSESSLYAVFQNVLRSHLEARDTSIGTTNQRNINSITNGSINSNNDTSTNSNTGSNITNDTSDVQDITAEFTASETLRAVLALRELGNNLAAVSSYPQAIQVYTEALDTCDWTCVRHVPQLLTNRALAYVGLNCFSEAIADLNRALTTDRTFTPAWTQVAYCHLYMGSGLLALRCYVMALRCIAGEIFPDNFPTDQDTRANYTNAKTRVLVPQFVQRLVQAVILAERRALQQRTSSLEVQALTTRTRAILVRLRAVVAPDDLSCLAYAVEDDSEDVRTAAQRSARVRPPVLTPEVAQDIMANSNIQGAAVVVPGPARTADGRTTVMTGPGTTVTTAPGTTTTTVFGQPEVRTFNVGDQEGLRTVFNNLGDVIGGLVHTQAQNFMANAGGAATGAATGAAPAAAPATGANANTGNGQQTGQVNVEANNDNATNIANNNTGTGAATDPVTETPGAGPTPDAIGTPGATTVPGANGTPGAPRMPGTFGTFTTTPNTGADTGAGTAARPAGAPGVFTIPGTSGTPPTAGQNAPNFRGAFNLPNIAGGIGGIIREAMRHHEQALNARNINGTVNGQPRVVTVTHNTTTTTHQTPENREDTEMPDAPDAPALD